MLRKNTRVWKQCAHQEHHFLYIISRCIKLKHGRARGCMRMYYIRFRIEVCNPYTPTSALIILSRRFPMDSASKQVPHLSAGPT